MTSMASVDARPAGLSLAAISCPDEGLTQLHKVSVATLFQVLNRLGFHIDARPAVQMSRRSRRLPPLPLRATRGQP